MVQPQAVQDGCLEVMDVNRRILYPGSVLHLRNREPYYGKEGPMGAGLTGAVASGRVQGRGFRPMGALIDPIPKQPTCREVRLLYIRTIQRTPIGLHYT